MHLTSASLILLLISSDFIHSDACDAEMQKALTLHHAGRARAVPILLRPVAWEESPVAGLQLLPLEGKPITTWHNREEAFPQVINVLSPASIWRGEPTPAIKRYGSSPRK